MDVQHRRLDSELGVTGLHFGLPPQRERSAGLGEVADVAVGERDQFDLVPLCREQRGRAFELELGIIRMRPERNNPQRPVRGPLAGDGLDQERQQRGAGVSIGNA